jgi:hypothetical protein
MAYLACLPLLCHTPVLSQPKHFSVYSSFVPYRTELEALTYDTQNSSYVRVLREGWQFHPTAIGGICVNRVELPQDWSRQKLFLHFPGVKFDYQIMVNDTLRED